jgi:hypothetical protein
MKTFSKLKVIFGVKGLLCLASLSLIAFALVTYTANVIINPVQQFTIGSTSDSWSVYVNDVNKIRYLPGGSTELTLDTGNTSTYAFKAVTDAQKLCAIKIELTSAINSSKFSNFNITAKYWSGSAWTDETIYNAATGSTPKSYIDGLTLGDSAYIHQALSTTRYYSVKVAYSYDKVDETAQTTATFQYTPLPQDSF